MYNLIMKQRINIRPTEINISLTFRSTVTVLLKVSDILILSQDRGTAGSSLTGVTVLCP